MVGDKARNITWKQNIKDFNVRLRSVNFIQQATEYCSKFLRIETTKMELCFKKLFNYLTWKKVWETEKIKSLQAESKQNEISI